MNRVAVPPRDNADSAGAEKTRRIRLAITGSTIAVFAYVLLIAFAGWDEILSALDRLSFGDWSLLLALSLLHFALRFGRWQVYLEIIGHHVPCVLSAAYYLSGFALTMTPGKVGEAWRAVYLRPHGVPYSDTVACFFAERYTDLLAILLLSILALGIYEGTLWPLALAVLLIVGALLAVRSPALPAMLDRLGARYHAGILVKTGEALARTLRVSSALLSLRLVLGATLLGLFAWGAQGVLLYAVLQMLGEPGGLLIAIGIYALAMLAGALSFLPGGLGSAEAVMILLLLVTGLDVANATAATLICRVATLWFAVGLGVLAILGLAVRRRLIRDG